MDLEKKKELPPIVILTELWRQTCVWESSRRHMYMYMHSICLTFPIQVGVASTSPFMTATARNNKTLMSETSKITSDMRNFYHGPPSCLQFRKNCIKMPNAFLNLA